MRFYVCLLFRSRVCLELRSLKVSTFVSIFACFCVCVCLFVSIYGMASKVISMDFSELDHRSSTENEDRSEKKSGAVVSSKVFSRFIFSFQCRFRKSQFLSRSSKASLNLL